MAVERDPVPALSTIARRTLRPAVGWVAWLSLGVLTVAFALGLSVPRVWRYAPLLASVLLFGLPHGAADWVALPRAVAGRVTARWVAIVCALYVALGALYGAVWFLAPVTGAIVFVALTWLHWGQGDIHPLVAVFGVDYLDARPLRVLTVIVRGGLPMLVPLLAFPDRYRTVVRAFATPFGGNLTAWPTPTTRLLLGGAFAGLTLVTLAWGYRRTADRRAWAVDAGETGLLWAFFLTVPPVLAVGVYFCLWHSLRHVARVLTLEERSRDALDAGALGPGLARFAAEAALPTAGALAIGAGLWLLAPAPELTVRGVTAVYLVAIAVLTLPHVVVVTWLDRADGLW